MRSRYRVLYLAGLLPWASDQIPPELIGLVEAIPDRQPLTAVDLGCGTGIQARYLARHGWQVTAIDYIPQAIRRARNDDPEQLVQWRLADVTDLGQVDPNGTLAGRTRLVLDNGCLHGIPTRGQPGWAATVNHLAHPDADLLIRAAPPASRWPGPTGITPATIIALLGDGWTQVPAPSTGWYRYQRPQTDIAMDVTEHW